MVKSAISILTGAAVVAALVAAEVAFSARAAELRQLRSTDTA